MIIANWNVERLKHQSELDEIIHILNEINADIVILTETDSQIKLDYKYCYSTPKLIEIAPAYYKETENRVSIYTNYELIGQYDTYDRYTALCIELATEYGNLRVYGTIIGIYGNRHPNFAEDLVKQTADFQRLSENQNLCVAGDFNISLADDYYYTKFGRETLNRSFENLNIAVLTRNRQQCIDHIAVSKKFLGNASAQIVEWNYDKRLSDHKGIYTDINVDAEQN